MAAEIPGVEDQGERVRGERGRADTWGVGRLLKGRSFGHHSAYSLSSFRREGVVTFETPRGFEPYKLQGNGLLALPFGGFSSAV